MKLKRQLSFLLTACLLGTLAGCGAPGQGGATPDTASKGKISPAGTATAMGRWVESEVSLGEGLYLSQAPVLLDDGSLWAFAENDDSAQLHKFVSTDDGITWTDEPLDWADTTGGRIDKISVSGNGSVFFEVYDKDGGASGYWHQPAGGTLAPVDFTGLLADIAPYNSFASANFMDDDTLLLMPVENSPNGSVTATTEVDTPPILYTLSTGTALTLTGVKNPGLTMSAVSRVKAADGTPALNYISYTADACQLSQLDKTGKLTILAETLPNAASGDRGASDADGNYYYIGQDGIYRMAKGGTLGEQLLATAVTSLSNKYPMSLVRTAAGDFMVLAMDMSFNDCTLYRYHWDSTLPSEAADQLTVWSLYDSPSVRTAILEYTADNPDLGVTYEPIFADTYSEQDSQTKDDALRTLNTELLAGNGPDVLLLDGVDYAAYAQNGLLAKLSDAVDTAALAQNLAAPFVTDGKATVLPARFGVPVLTGRPGDVDRLTSLDALRQAVEENAPRPDVDGAAAAYSDALPENEQFAFSFMTTEQILEFVMETSAPALLRDGAVDADAVRQALGFVAAVGTRYDMKNYRPAAEQSNGGVQFGSTDTDPVTILSRTDEYLNSRARYGWGTMSTTAFCYVAVRNDPDSDGYLPTTSVLRPGLVEGAYLPSVLTAVNAGSKKLEQAKAFVSILFGEAAQNAYSDEGMPVLQSALDASVARNALGSQSPMGQAFQGDAAALLAACKTPVILGDTINAAMLTHAEALISGAEDLDAAVKGVERDLALYLAEQQ